MPRGGKRPGAGRPKGRKNDATIGKDIALAASLSDGLGPVAAAAARLPDGYTARDLLQAMYKDPTTPDDLRFAAAVKAMPFETAKPRVSTQASAGGITFTFRRHVPSGS